MALPPTIPTSFIPHAASAPAHKFRGDLTGAFGFFAYGVLVLVFVLALGIFFYGRILDSSKTSKDVELASAQAAIDSVTVDNFVRLRNRLSSSKTLLDGHAAFSGFFSALEKILPASTRFTTIHLSRSDGGPSKIEGAGMARSFNALAAASNAFATDGRIKDAIFSNISVNKDSTVSFSLSATLDPKLIIFEPSAAVSSFVPAAPVDNSAPVNNVAATSSPASPEATQGTAPTL